MEMFGNQSFISNPPCRRVSTVNKLTQIFVDSWQVLLDCYLVTVSCHVSLSVGHLIVLQLTSLKESEGQRKQDQAKGSLFLKTNLRSSYCLIPCQKQVTGTFLFKMSRGHKGMNRNWVSVELIVEASCHRHQRA